MKRVSARFEEDRDEANITVLFRASHADAQVEELMNRVREPFVGTISVTDTDGTTVPLPLEHIMSISSDNKRLKVLADKGTYWLKASLQEMDKLLAPNMFLRISRYEIVNLRKVVRFDFTISGTLRIELEQIQLAYEEGTISRAAAQEMRENVYLMQVDVEDDV